VSASLRDRAVRAGHRGRCNLCQEPIEEGDWIVHYDAGDGWVHLECAEAEDG